MSEDSSETRSTPRAETPGFPGFQQVLHLTLHIHNPPATDIPVHFRSDPPGPDGGETGKGDRAGEVKPGDKKG